MDYEERYGKLTEYEDLKKAWLEEFADELTALNGVEEKKARRAVKSMIKNLRTCGVKYPEIQKIMGKHCPFEYGALE